MHDQRVINSCTINTVLCRNASYRNARVLIIQAAKVINTCSNTKQNTLALCQPVQSVSLVQVQFRRQILVEVPQVGPGIIICAWRVEVCHLEGLLQSGDRAGFTALVAIVFADLPRIQNISGEEPMENSIQ